MHGIEFYSIDVGSPSAPEIFEVFDLNEFNQIDFHLKLINSKMLDMAWRRYAASSITMTGHKQRMRPQH